MKLVLILITSCTLISCNTTIGLWRDTKDGYHWTKNKIQNSGSNSGGQEYEYGAPVY
ncbi:hypothetical protein ACFSSA_08365 [Luteolibacter algae]|uniref:Lipoprotein n=1 Tax=Luteolibacter algae TaxID=454151 RepID=A0ABW5D6H1_9BACT